MTEGTPTSARKTSDTAPIPENGTSNATPDSTDMNGTYNDDVPDLVDNDSISEAEYDSNNDESDDEHDLDDLDILDMLTPTVTFEEDNSPQPLNLCGSTCIRKPNPRYANHTKSYEWESNMVETEQYDLAHACAIEAAPTLPNSNDVLSWEPAPSSICEIIKLKEGAVKQEWLKSVRKELKTLVDSNTFPRRHHAFWWNQHTSHEGFQGKSQKW